LNAMQALLPLHKQLEDGRPLDAAALSNILSQLETIAAQLKPNTPAAPAPKGS
jgi:hypothetical protein